MQIVLAVSVMTVALASVHLPPHCDGQRAAAESQKANFSGVWTATRGSTPDPPPGSGELPALIDWYSPVTITQDESTLTVEYRTYARSHALRKFVYRLDGTATANVMTGSIDPQGRTSTAVWDGAKLILTDAVDQPSSSGTTRKRLERKILSLESPDVMRVDVTLTLGDRTSATKIVRFVRPRSRLSGS
jgi:hypothetical protein